MKNLRVCVFALLLTGCRPEPKVPEQTFRREQKRVAELAAEVDQGRAVQRVLERNLAMAGCAIAVLAGALIAIGHKKGG